MDSKNDFKVDFICIGAAKAGTRWLSDVLKQHDQVFVPMEKELFYWNQVYAEYEEVKNDRYDNDLDWYHSFFENSEDFQVRGEICNAYLFNENSAADIHNYNPNIKLFAVLRSPADRAYSHYYYDKFRHFKAPESFEKAIEERPFYLEQGLYYKMLRRYYDLFPKEQIKILLFDDLKKDKRNYLKEIYEFIGVDVKFPEHTDKQSNVTREPKFKGLNQAIDFCRYTLRTKAPGLLPVLRKTGIVPAAEYIRDFVNRKDSKTKPPMNPETRKKLNDYYAQDLAQLEDLIEKDLSAWKAV